METILIVDDDKDMQFTLTEILRDEGYEVIAVGDGEHALKEVTRKEPNLVLLDIMLPGMDGLKILEKMGKIDKDLTVIMLTAYGNTRGAVKAMKLGAFDYITKPFDNEELVITIKKALHSQYLSREVERLRKRLGESISTEDILSESSQIKQILKQVDIVAPTNMTVILQGESGTGKELIARLIHQKSARCDRPFIAIDCGAIPDTLIESELFGYDKGAFTGAVDRKEGKFEKANAGTLFLDEISNLSEAAQVKLLRVIQERRLQHLGGKKDVKVDVRIIVATNTNLSEVVRAGRFRDDLFHRLNEFCITIPPLRERKEDIPLLANYFLDGANNEFNRMIKGLSTEAMKFLFNYHWPGNVRELRNVIRRSVLLTESEYIMPTHLSIETSIVKPQDEINLTETPDEEASFEDITRRFDRDLIKKALEEAGDNKTKAAKILQMNRKTLYRKMKSLGL